MYKHVWKCIYIYVQYKHILGHFQAFYEMVAPCSDLTQSILFLHLFATDTVCFVPSSPYKIACSLRVGQSLFVVFSAMFVTRWVTDRCAWKGEEKERRQK